jgi:hypothetical protein
MEQVIKLVLDRARVLLLIIVYATIMQQVQIVMFLYVMELLQMIQAFVLEEVTVAQLLLVGSVFAIPAIMEINVKRQYVLDKVEVVFVIITEIVSVQMFVLAVVVMEVRNANNLVVMVLYLVFAAIMVIALDQIHVRVTQDIQVQTVR